MNVTFACPTCGESSRQEFGDATPEIACSHCNARLALPDEAVTGGQVHRCLVCPSTELFVRKDFSQRLGVSIVVTGLAASCVAVFFHNMLATYAILFLTAGVDFVLYFFTGNALQCYRCQAEYRGVAGLEEHEPFNLETHERYRQQAARLAQAQDTASKPSAGH